jgi:DNA-binding transcriptional LysR family regulator
MSVLDNLANLQTFVHAADTRSFVETGRLQGISASAAGKCVARLEHALGVRLFHRSTRSITLTAEGALFLERSRRILAEIEAAQLELSQASTAPRGRLRVDISASLALLVLVPALPDFFARYPDIQLDLGVTDRAVDLVGENVDCVIRGGDLTDPSLIARRIGEIHRVTCATPSYLARYGTPAHPRDLETDFPTVRYFNARTGRLLPLEFEHAGETLELEGRYMVAVNDGNSYLAAGLAGLGIIQLPTFMAQTHIGAGTLVPVLTPWTTESFPVFTVFPPNRHLSARLRVFVDWIAELFAGHDLIQRRSTLPRPNPGAA